MNNEHYEHSKFRLGKRESKLGKIIFFYQNDMVFTQMSLYLHQQSNEGSVRTRRLPNYLCGKRCEFHNTNFSFL